MIKIRRFYTFLVVFSREDASEALGAHTALRAFDELIESEYTDEAGVLLNRIITFFSETEYRLDWGEIGRALEACVVLSEQESAFAILRLLLDKISDGDGIWYRPEDCKSLVPVLEAVVNEFGGHDVASTLDVEALMTPNGAQPSCSSTTSSLPAAATPTRLCPSRRAHHLFHRKNGTPATSPTLLTMPEPEIAESFADAVIQASPDAAAQLLPAVLSSSACTASESAQYTRPVIRYLATLFRGDTPHVVDAAHWLLTTPAPSVAQAFADVVTSASPSVSDPLLPTVLKAAPRAAGSPQYTPLARHRLAMLPQTDSAPAVSWSQPDATLPDYPNLEAFLRGPNKGAIVTGIFSGIHQAREFAARFTGAYNATMKCSATAKASGSGSSPAALLRRSLCRMGARVWNGGR
ncbi:hypothetical protein BDK51DRAFT_39755 [Blyttiomyces helicus]|uniref:Uncharacterized protein n=1 Tax=Blyttiomyces helicus TaxID=388810 RepID=A0A4P9WCX5_9FUNG|nr:hypothetical protein BDK51DRAFT_39755 [Blyttiomyces helicus]|eukprot:RKO88770.1 hypothetical protein BDK51DRAFT_39755 [Blyttiomyces helicus]